MRPATRVWIGAQARRAGKDTYAIVRRCVSLVSAGLLLALLAGCADQPEEQALRATFKAMQVALEDRQASAFMDAVAEDFTGEGGLSRDELARMLRFRMLQHSAIGVSTGPLDVEMTDSRARVSFSALVTGGSGRLMPDQARTYQVETAWRFDGRWRLISAQWR